MKSSLTCSLLVIATFVTFVYGQTFSYIERPPLVQGEMRRGVKTDRALSSIGALYCSAVNVVYQVDHSEIYGTLFSGEAENARVVSVAVENGEGAHCIGNSSISEVAGPYHQVAIPFGECGVSWNRFGEQFTYSAVILMKTRVYYTPIIYHEYQLRQPFICSGDTAYEASFNVQHVSQAADLETNGGSFSVEQKILVVSTIQNITNGYVANVPTQVILISFALQDNMTHMYQLLVDKCWGNFNETDPYIGPKVDLLNSQGCVQKGLSEKIQDNPLTYRFPAFEMEDNPEKKMLIHCNINYCRTNGFDDKCVQRCSQKRAESLLKRVDKSSADAPYSKSISTEPQDIIRNNEVQPRVTYQRNGQIKNSLISPI